MDIKTGDSGAEPTESVDRSESRTASTAAKQPSANFADGSAAAARPRRPYSRFLLLLRRLHLYAGLLMLPWVLLYGVTGAMFNHQGLFPNAEFQSVSDDAVAEAMAEFPDARTLAKQVVATLQQQAGGVTIELAAEPNAEFTGDIAFEQNGDKGRDVVYLDPVQRTAEIGWYDPNEEQTEAMLTDVRNIQLSPNPQQAARSAAAAAMKASGRYPDQDPRPFGWTKLNFLANVDDQPVRITYVLKDGHVDVSKFDGNDGMPLRHFLLRLHTSHGQPPHWNGRMFWSLAVDTMAVAMVLWAISGLLMWWQIKRTRVVGAFLLIISAGTATFLWFSVHDFYAATRL